MGWPPELGRPGGRQRPGSGAARVGIVGFYGPGNYGDELFLEVFREHLGAGMDLGVVFDSPTRPYFSRPVRDIVRDHDAIVIGGGDLLVPWGLADRYWLPDYLRRPVHVIGVGVPTWRDEKPAVVAALSDYLRHRNVRSISARDEESAAWIREQLRPRVPVGMAADLVFALPLPEIERPVGPPILGITVRWREGGDDYAAVRRWPSGDERWAIGCGRSCWPRDEVRERDEGRSTKSGSSATTSSRSRPTTSTS